MTRLSEIQVAQLAPDPPSLKAGRQLANPRLWLATHINDRVLWGEVQGSGKDPYRTQIDLGAIAFKCTCPSRKFPCKHGLALLLLRAQNAAAFGQGEPPAWVAKWLASRQQRAEK